MNSPRTILVVEDDVELGRMYRLALAFEGYRVQVAGDGFEALRLIDCDPPDLVVLDWMLPTVSGQIVHQEIAAGTHTRHIPVVVVTGAEMGGEALPVQCLLKKPVSPDRLIKAIRKCLGRASSARM